MTPAKKYQRLSTTAIETIRCMYLSTWAAMGKGEAVMTSLGKVGVDLMVDKCNTSKLVFSVKSLKNMPN